MSARSHPFNSSRTLCSELKFAPPSGSNPCSSGRTAGTHSQGRCQGPCPRLSPHSRFFLSLCSPCYGGGPRSSKVTCPGLFSQGQQARVNSGLSGSRYTRLQSLPTARQEHVTLLLSCSSFTSLLTASTSVFVPAFSSFLSGSFLLSSSPSLSHCVLPLCLHVPHPPFPSVSISVLLFPYLGDSPFPEPCLSFLCCLCLFPPLPSSVSISPGGKKAVSQKEAQRDSG